ncbi:MAG: fimbria/pilus outer membrane usher protein [Gemmobacter sp.]
MSSPKRRLTLAAGDVQSSALAWTRSVRMGGVQLRRDFGLRSDLVTQQLLSFDGAAAVPSTVDVFIDNNRTYSGGQDPGPFRLEDLPARSRPGEALIVVTDANGRRTTRAVSFYVSQKLLKKGLLDFSIEAGRAREGCGTECGRYGEDSILSSSLRYGLTERMTVEGNVQVKSDLTLLGLGLTTVPFNLAEVSVAVGASEYQGVTAGFAYGAVQTRLGSVDINGSVRLSEDGHADLAYATGVDFLGQDAVAGTAPLLETQRMQTALSLSVPVDGDTNLGLGYVASRRENSRDELVTMSLGCDLPDLNGSFSLYGSHDLISGDTRAAMGLTIATGKRKTVRTNLSRDPDGSLIGGVHLARAISDRHGDYGYSAELQRDRTGDVAFSGQASTWAVLAGRASRSGRATARRVCACGWTGRWR